MITVQEAIGFISKQVRSFGDEVVSLQEACGRILSEDLSADRDYPPFDRVTMDGIAINYEAFKKGNRSFAIESVGAAGSPFQILHNQDNCIEIMTGAGMPKGTDTVIKYEELDIDETAKIATLLPDVDVTFKQNVHFQGSDHLAGKLLLKKDTILRPSDIGIAASLGHSDIKLKKLPKTAIISTGDELVNIDEIPLPHQIRKSNVYTIKSRLEHYAIKADLFHLVDEKDAIRNSLIKIIKDYEVVILSGGVSKGKFDYIPEILTELGVVKDFHKIKQRPGKPFWFGRTDETIIFALPGNPVSSFVCTKKYIEHWLCQSLGIERKLMYAELAKDVQFNPDLHYFLEVDLEYTKEAKVLAHPKKGNGSGDFINLTRAQAFVELPRGKNIFHTGDIFPILLFDS